VVRALHAPMRRWRLRGPAPAPPRVCASARLRSVAHAARVRGWSASLLRNAAFLFAKPASRRKTQSFAAQRRSRSARTPCRQSTMSRSICSPGVREGGRIHATRVRTRRAFTRDALRSRRASFAMPPRSKMRELRAFLPVQTLARREMRGERAIPLASVGPRADVPGKRAFLAACQPRAVAADRLALPPHGPARQTFPPAAWRMPRRRRRWKSRVRRFDDTRSSGFGSSFEVGPASGSPERHGAHAGCTDCRYGPTAPARSRLRSAPASCRQPTTSRSICRRWFSRRRRTSSWRTAMLDALLPGGGLPASIAACRIRLRVAVAVAPNSRSSALVERPDVASSTICWRNSGE